MDFSSYVRKPFLVEALLITEENIKSVAPYIGDLRDSPDGPWIYVDPKMVPNVHRVFPGYWITKMGDRVRCYAGKIFEEQFTKSNDDIAAWVDFLKNGGIENSRVVNPNQFKLNIPNN